MKAIIESMDNGFPSGWTIKIECNSFEYDKLDEFLKVIKQLPSD